MVNSGTRYASIIAGLSKENKIVGVGDSQGTNLKVEENGGQAKNIIVTS